MTSASKAIAAVALMALLAISVISFRSTVRHEQDRGGGEPASGAQPCLRQVGGTGRPSIRCADSLMQPSVIDPRGAIPNSPFWVDSISTLRYEPLL